MAGEDVLCVRVSIKFFVRKLLHLAIRNDHREYLRTSPRNEPLTRNDLLNNFNLSFVS